VVQYDRDVLRPVNYVSFLILYHLQPRLNSSKSSALYCNTSAFKVVGTDSDQTDMILVTVSQRQIQ
jgi:hypothetical protein